MEQARPAAISTDEFIRKARFAGIREITLIVSYQADMQSRKVCSLDFTISSDTDEMRQWIGIDLEDLCWFDDGTPIPDISGARPFTTSEEPRGTALARVQQLLCLINKLEKSGLEMTIIGPNINMIFEWIKQTLERG